MPEDVKGDGESQSSQEEMSVEELRALAEQLRAKVAEAEKRARDLQARMREVRVRAAVEVAAQAAGLYSVEDALALADWTDVEIDEETGKVEGVEAALGRLAKERPYLVRQGRSADGPPDAAARGGGQRDPKEREEELRQRFRI